MNNQRGGEEDRELVEREREIERGRKIEWLIGDGQDRQRGIQNETEDDRQVNRKIETKIGERTDREANRQKKGNIHREDRR